MAQAKRIYTLIIKGWTRFLSFLLSGLYKREKNKTEGLCVSPLTWNTRREFEKALETFIRRARIPIAFLFSYDSIETGKMSSFPASHSIHVPHETLRWSYVIILKCFGLILTSAAANSPLALTKRKNTPKLKYFKPQLHYLNFLARNLWHW